jgi:hypothetical protein
MRIARFGFETWIKWVFDHPVTEREWWWDAADFEVGGRWLDRPAWRVIRFMTRLFEDPVPCVAPYSDEQIDQGLWFIFHDANSRHICSLSDGRVSYALRLRCLRSIVALHERLLVPRCAEVLNQSREREPGATPLNSICYMLWDFVYKGTLEDPGEWDLRKAIWRNRSSNPKFVAHMLEALQRVLAIPHKACQEAAVHGLGHVQGGHPGEASVIIDEYLSSNPSIDPRLREYALCARAGKIM